MEETHQCSIEEIHEMDLEMLQELDRFFAENNIRYSVAAGTALGAVRHKGFIPWDDDVDLDMHIDDMRRLAKLWKKKGLPGFFLQNKWTDPNVPWPHWRIRKKGTTSMTERGLTIPMHWGLPIDIFMILNAPKSNFLKRKMDKIYRKAERLSSDSYLKNKNKFRNMISNFRCRFLHRVLFFLSDISKKSGELYYPGNFKTNFFKKEVFFPIQRIKFDRVETNGHNNEHEYLSKIFGDYMQLPPEEKRIGHLSFIVDLNKDFSEYVTYDCSKYV